MFRLIASASLVACLVPAALAAGTGTAQAAPRIIYTRHVLKVDISGLDLSRDADRRALQVRLGDAADEVCGGRPDRGNRYTKDELKQMLPAYDRCRSDAAQKALASINLPTELAAPSLCCDRHDAYPAWRR
jgi:UrcA family protein